VLLSATEQCFVAPFLNLADSRSGRIQRASNYTSENPISKRFLGYFCGFFAALIELDLNVHAQSAKSGLAERKCRLRIDL